MQDFIFISAAAPPSVISVADHLCVWDQRAVVPPVSVRDVCLAAQEELGSNPILQEQQPESRAV